MKLHVKHRAWHVLSQWASLVKSQRWMGERRQRSFQCGWRTGGRGRVLCETGQRGGPAGRQSYSNIPSYPLPRVLSPSLGLYSTPPPQVSFSPSFWLFVPLSSVKCSIFPADAPGTLGRSGLELPGTLSAGV